MNKWTYAQHISYDNSGEYYSYTVVAVVDHYALYVETQCGFGGDFDSAIEAETAAKEWQEEMETNRTTER